MHKSALFALLLVIAFMGCKKASVSDLTGTWVLASSRVRLPRELQKADGTIVLNSDGTFSVSELPLLFWDGKGTPPSPISGAGTWKRGNWLKQGDQIQLTFCAFEGFQPKLKFPGVAEPPPLTTSYLSIRRTWPLAASIALSYVASPNEMVIEFRKKID